MNKNLILSLGAVIVLGLGLWWFTAHTTLNDAQTPTDSSNPGISISASGSPSISVFPSVSPTKTASAQNITITSPKNNELVDPIVTVTGRARVFENQFTVQLTTSTGEVVWRNTIMSDAKDSGLFGNYSVKVPIPAGVGNQFTIEVFSLSPKGDNTYEGYAKVAVKLKSTAESKLYVAFMTGDSCTSTTLYPRIVYKSTQPALMSIAELLVGPAPVESSKGAATQIPADTQLNSIKIVSGTAYADFNQGLQQGVAGSCRVQAIRAQITETLKQFLGVNDVVISIDGRTADILQP